MPTTVTASRNTCSWPKRCCRSAEAASFAKNEATLAMGVDLVGQIGAAGRAVETPYRPASSSAREKKKASSICAFSGESLPWVALH